MSRNFEYALVACARWETESIAEWLVYHRHIGFDHAFIYCNDDDPHELYEAVLPFAAGPNPFVTFYHFGLQGQQEQMYLHFLRNHSQQCDWFMCSDIDEFLLLRHHDSVCRLIKSLPNRPCALHFHSVNAGNNDHVTRPSGLSIQNFNRRTEHAAPFTKSIIQGRAVNIDGLDGVIQGAWWHNSAIITKPGSLVVDVLGNDMTHYYRDSDAIWPKLQSDPEFHRSIIDTAFIYHIGMKSEADLMRRYQRGVKGDFISQTVWREVAAKGQNHVAEYLAHYNAVREDRLNEVWSQIMSGAVRRQIVKAPLGENIAPRGVATQSSVSAWSRHPEIELDARGPIDGHPGPFWKHHTQTEHEPWWMVDLGETARIREIRIFGRVDAVRDRLRNFVLTSSNDRKNWAVLMHKDDNVPFGGIDGRPVIWRAPDGTDARFIKLTGIGTAILDLAQVEVY